ncbi:MAG: carboxypeptidase-like regulatory domain-containing protein [Gemmatimonadales bacterium]
MNRMIGVACAVLALGVAGCHQRTNAAPFVGGVTVNGRVVDFRGMAVNGAEVNLYEADVTGRERPLLTSTSNGSGNFALRSVEPGVYLLRVVKNGFRESSQQLKVGGGYEQTVTVQLY